MQECKSTKRPELIPEFAFYVNKNGWRSRPRWAIVWEGVPTAFGELSCSPIRRGRERQRRRLIAALQYPYVIAFEPTFVEVHHVETGHLVQIIPGHNISCLFADTPPSRVNAPVPPPTRPMMFQQTGYRPVPYQHPSYGHPGHPSHPGQPTSGAQGQYGQPSYPPQMRPPMGYGGMQRPPPQPMPVIPPNRFMRNQVIFTSDDGHVQFLKFPTSQSGPGSGSGAGVGLGAGVGAPGGVQGAANGVGKAQPPLPPLPALPHGRASPHLHTSHRMSH